ncbi:MAG: heme ABC exporter ATP-binding protein CcmA [Candidatus Binatia bacterium]
MAVRHLSKAYGFLWALKDVGFDLQPGECVALLGPNGAGKTTLLRLLSALLYPTTGEIQLDGETLHQGSSRLRSTIGFFSPNEHLYENLTAKENLRFFNSLYGKGRNSQELEETLDAVGLIRWSDDYVSSLSSGMKCRLAIAKWLLLEPKLLLLDEPYGVLDGSGVDLLESYLRRLCHSGGIAVIATHHVPRVLTLCSRAIILHQGRVLFDEPRQEPWENFRRAFEEFLPRGERWSS